MFQYIKLFLDVLIVLIIALFGLIITYRYYKYR